MVSIFTKMLMIQYDSGGETVLQDVHKYTNKCTKMHPRMLIVSERIYVFVTTL